MTCISFVIPVLNGEQYIGRCLESILAEVAPQDEIIVIDNGSTDATASIVESYGRPRLEICPHITVSAVRNRGAELADCDVLAFIDSDCLLVPGWRKQVTTVLSDESVHATGAACEVPEDAGWIEKAWFSQKKSEPYRAGYLNTANLVVRARIFSQLGGFDESLASDEDCEFGERLNGAGFVMIEDPAIRVVHLGNPTTLAAFYTREKWHATSVLEAGSVDIMNLPNIMSFAFGLSLLVALAGLILGLFLDPRYFWLLAAVFVVPCVTAVYRAIKFDKLFYIPALSLLWGVFFTARVRNMVTVLLGR